MTTPTTTPRIGQRGTQPGLFQLGAKVGALNPAPSTATIPTTAVPYIAHIYNNALTTFKTTLTVLNRPKLKWSLNGGYDHITLNTQVETAANLYGAPLYGNPLYGGIALGDICRLTEQNSDGSIVYTGIIEKIIDTYDNPAVFALVLTPLVAELGDTGFSTNYATPIDIAQMVRDAVASTLHLKFNSYTVPDTGQKAVYNFPTTNCLDVLNVARLMAGTNYWWLVDATGYVWFQPMGAKAEHSLYQTQHFTSLTRQPDITKQKNNFTVIGGIPSGSTAAITASYVGSSTATVGKRTIMPPPTFPTVTNQAVLNNLAATIGGVLDRMIHRIDMLVNNYNVPITPNQPGGPMIRFWEPVKYPTQQASIGTGNYSANYIVLENERDGPIQKLKLGDIPVNNVDDLKYMLDNLVRYQVVNQQLANPVISQGGRFDGGTIQNATIQTAHSPAVTLVDSTGILSNALITPVANQDTGFIGQSFTAVGIANAVDVTNSTFTVTLTRAAYVLFIATATIGVTAGGSDFAQVFLSVDNVQTGPLGGCGFLVNEFSVSTIVAVPLLAAGAHTCKLKAYVGTAGNTGEITQADTVAIQLGS